MQFETIHPYLDGNGRIGRLLITLLLEHWNQLSEPLLYLSLFFMRHRAEYYRLLNGVRHDGAWEVLAARNASVMAARLLEQLPRHPMLTIPTAVKLLQTSKPTATKAIGVLEQLGVLKEATGRRRDRTFSYTGYLELLRRGTADARP